MKQVYRLLRPRDVAPSLVGRDVHVLWPDDGTWYAARVRRVSAKAGTAALFYTQTDEKEDADLRELIGDGHIAFRERAGGAGAGRAGGAEGRGQGGLAVWVGHFPLDASAAGSAGQARR